MKKIMPYILIFVLIVSSASYMTYKVENYASAEINGPPAANTSTLQKWTVQSFDFIQKYDQIFGTVDIEIEKGGYMKWERMTVYVGGNFSINGTFEAVDTTIYIEGPYFNIYGSMNLINCNLIFNTTADGVPATFAQADSYVNITQSTLRANNDIFKYNWTFEAKSHSSINYTTITDCGNTVGMLVKSSDVEFDTVVFKDNFHHLDILDASPKIKNSTFHGAQHLSSITPKKGIVVSGNSEVHAVSCKWLNASTEGQINGAGILWVDYFVIVETLNNTKLMGVGESNIGFQDSTLAVVNVQTLNDSSANQGKAQPVRCSNKKYDAVNWPTGDASLNNYTITVSDKWDELLGSAMVPPSPRIINMSMEMPNAQEQIIVTFIFDFKPIIKELPTDVAVTEDNNDTFPFVFHDKDYWPDNPSEVVVSFNSSYVKYIPSLRQISIIYPDGQPANSVINVNLTDVDGNSAEQDINVTFTPVNNPPKITSIIQNFDVYEDEPKFIPLTYQDIDTPLSQVTISTNRTQYVNKHTNNSLRILYPNDFGHEGKQDDVEVWAHDGLANSSSEGQIKLLITFHQTPDAPEITKTIANQIMVEDDKQITINLTTYWKDIDYDVDPTSVNIPGWYAEGATKSSIKISNETFLMTIDPKDDAFGDEQVELFLEDKDGLSDSILFWVMISPFNDVPEFRDTDFTPDEAEAGEFFTFFVVYYDLENDQPAFVKLQIDGNAYEMTKSEATDNDYTDGAKYEVSVQLFTEKHDYRYVISDGTDEVTSEFVYTAKSPKIINKLRIATKWSVNKEFMVKIGYFSKAGGTITINENPSAPGNSTYPIETSDVGYFYGVSTTIKNVQWIYMEFNINTANFTDVFVNDEEVKIRYYDTGAKQWNLTTFRGNEKINGDQSAWANFSMDLSSDVLFAPMGPINNDIDGDGEPNDNDWDPFDPDEQRDSDGDGYGDNEDKFDNDPSVHMDSDGDTYPDEWNTGYTSSTVDPDLYLDEFPNDASCSRDFDEDDDCDEIDEDDDGDGIPDLFEKQYEFLDEYNPDDAILDFDGDKASNLDEYLAHTDPSDPLEVPPGFGNKDDDEDLMTIIILILVIVVVVVIGVVMFMRKPKKKDEEDMPPAAAPPAYAPPVYEQVPAVEPGMEAPIPPEGQVPLPPPEGEVPVVETGAEAPGEGEVTPEAGTEYVVDDSAGESMVPEDGDVIAEGEDAEDMLEDEEAEAEAEEDGDELLEE